MNHHKRKFLTTLGVGSLTMAAGCSKLPSAFAEADNNLDVRYEAIVIGAGMAGLAAAHSLRQAGKKVLILEARSRFGGRIYTDRSFASTPIEIGAELIHGSEASTWAIARTAGVGTLPMNRVLARKDGKWMSPDFAYAQENVIDPMALPPTKRNESMAAYMSRTGLSVSQLPLNVRLSDLDNEPFRYIDAARALGMSEDDESEDYPDLDYRLIGGYDQLLTPLVRGADIQFNAAVKEIRRAGGGVEIHYVQNGIASMIRAESAIITIPLGVLKRRDVRFVPDLPADRWSDIDSLGVVTATKMIFKFSDKVLPADATALLNLDATPGQWWSSSAGNARATEEEIIVGWAAGDKARQLLKMPRAVAADYCLDALRRDLGRPTLKHSAFTTYDWLSDPFARGAYSYTPVGTPAGNRRRFASPIADTLFWAGEATSSEGYGNVHGAYDSGRRAANEVLKRLGQRDPGPQSVAG